MNFDFTTCFQSHLKRVLDLKDHCEIMFALRNLALHFSKKTSAYRRYAYELMREHPSYRDKIDYDIFLDLDRAASDVFHNGKRNGYVKDKSVKSKSLDISWEIQ